MFTVEQIENTCSTLAKVAKKKFIIDGVEVEKGSLMTKKELKKIMNFIRNGQNTGLIIQTSSNEEHSDKSYEKI